MTAHKILITAFCSAVLAVGWVVPAWGQSVVGSRPIISEAEIRQRFGLKPGAERDLEVVVMLINTQLDVIEHLEKAGPELVNHWRNAVGALAEYRQMLLRRINEEDAGRFDSLLDKRIQERGVKLPADWKTMEWQELPPRRREPIGTGTRRISAGQS